MKKIIKHSILALCLTVGVSTNSEAVTVVFDQPGVTFSARQPLQAVIVDSNGNTTQQTLYYDSSIGGVDFDASWAGANASVYFPTLNTGYVWYNGYWVDPQGYYWNGGARNYVGPHWNDYWGGYWRGRNYWNGDWHGGGWHGDGWRGDNWRGGEGNWRGGDGRGADFRGGDGRGAGFRDGDGRGGDFRGGEGRGFDGRGGGREMRGGGGGGHRR